MNKQAQLDEIKQAAYEDELEKIARDYNPTLSEAMKSQAKKLITPRKIEANPLGVVGIGAATGLTMGGLGMLAKKIIKKR